jgi:uncharacterized Zn ribbon protein
MKPEIEKTYITLTDLDYYQSLQPKGTIVKKIHLVADNPEQIEGKVNEQTIVILTKFVRKQG